MKMIPRQLPSESEAFYEDGSEDPYEEWMDPEVQDGGLGVRAPERVRVDKGEELLRQMFGFAPCSADYNFPAAVEGGYAC